MERPNPSEAARQRNLISFGQSVALLNEELRKRSWYRVGMEFVMTPGGTGYDLLGPEEQQKAWMAKEVHDLVFAKYTISR